MPEGCFLCFCALLESFYRVTPFHLVHILLSLYSRAHTYVHRGAYISALLHSSEQDSDLGKIIHRNAHHLAVTCAGGTNSHKFVWYLFSMPFTFCPPFLEPHLFILSKFLLSLHSRAHIPPLPNEDISALLRSSKQDSVKGKVIYKNMNQHAVACACGTF